MSTTVDDHERVTPADGVRCAEVIRALQQRILIGELKVGDRLPSERRLAADYDVSRTVIREAVRGLVERGQIEVIAKRGSFVRGVSSDDLAQPLERLALRAGVTFRDVVSARVMLECEAARLAAVNADDAAVEGLAAALAAHAAATTVSQRVSTDLAFHTAVMAAAGNPVLQIMYGAVHSFVIAMMTRSQVDAVARNMGEPTHDRLLAAIRAADPDAAVAAMRQHIALASSVYGDDFDHDIRQGLKRYGIDVGVV